MPTIKPAYTLLFYIYKNSAFTSKTQVWAQALPLYSKSHCQVNFLANGVVAESGKTAVLVF